VQPQGIAEIIETQTVGQLGKEHAHDVAPRTKGAGFLIHPCFSGQLRDQEIRNEIAKLPQNRQLGSRWMDRFLFFHPCRVAGLQATIQHFFYGMLVQEAHGLA
jgi:hypothetical protein